MANYASLKAAIRQVVKTNGNNEITGILLQQTLLSMIDSLGTFSYQFAGVAIPSTNPGTPDQNVFYIAGQSGTYSNFGTSLTTNEIGVFYYNGSWNVQKISRDIPVYYSLYGDSYIYKNTVYIDTLLIYISGKEGRLLTIQQNFSLNAGYFLVCNRETGNIRVSAQAGVTNDEDILLISDGPQNGFLFTGKLLGNRLSQTWYDTVLTVEQTGKAINSSGQLVSASGYSLSSPVYIESGTVVAVQTGGYLLSALSKVDGNTYTPIIVYGNDGIIAPRTTVTTIAESGNYVVSSNNFANVASLASNKKTEEAITLSRYLINDTLVAGAVWASGTQKGEVYQSCDGAQKKYFLSQRFLSINGKTDKINGIDGTNGLPIYVLQYDENYHLIGTVAVSTNFDLLSNCRYVKICLGNSTDRAFSKVFITFDISAKERPIWSYNGPNDFTTNPRILFRTYELTEPFITDNCVDADVTTSYRGIQSRIFNWGYIFLPKNYSRTGKPSPVIIHCHGTSGVVFNQQSLPYNTRYLEFLANCGYAVIGCSTFTDKYSAQRDDGNFPSPLAHSCYFNLWEYMTSEFNLDKSGAYIFGYSAGGMNTILLSQSKQIPIKAAAVLAGSVDLVSNMRILADYCNEHFFELIGLPNTDLPTGLAADGVRMHVMDSSVKSLILANKEKFTGRTPFNFNGDLDYWAFFDRYADVPNYTSNLINDTVLNGLVDGAKMFFNMPIKIWHAIDDTNVPIQMSRWWRKMVMNGGGLCYMREFPSGCGAHYAVGYTGDESLTPMVNYLTPFNETVNIPVAYAEMVDWFKRW